LLADSPKCSPNDLFCFENKSTDDSPISEYSGSYTDIVANYEEENNSIKNSSDVYDVDNETQNEDVLPVDDYDFKGLSIKYLAAREKRSPLELVEEHPPEATYRTPPDEGETRTSRSVLSMPSMPSMPSIPSMPSMPSIPSIPSMSSMPSVPSMPSMPSIPQPPTIPSLDPKQIDTPATNDFTTAPSNVEVLETTTEDYGNIGEPQCNYDVITFILKCGLNLLTSIFGLSDACCKPIF